VSRVTLIFLMCYNISKMPKGCIFSLIGSLFTMLAGAVFFIEYGINYQQVELTSLFEDLPYIESISYIILAIGLIILTVGVFKLFLGEQEEPNSIRGGLIDNQYTDENDRYNKV